MIAKENILKLIDFGVSRTYNPVNGMETTIGTHFY